MSMSNIPKELVEEILARVPATYLKRLRSTCKRWNTLFKKRRFTHNHFEKASKESMVVMLKEQKVCLMNVNLNVSPPSIEFKDTLCLKDSHASSEQVVEISEVFHCDGLLLCATKDNRLVVWNPCLGETKWIQRKTGYQRLSRYALGYENKKSCRSYKILKCWGCAYDNSEDVLVGFEIYEFSSDSWKVLDDVPPKCFPPANGVSLKGNTYWCRGKNNFLLNFDFTTERFKHCCLPPIHENMRCRALSVVGEEQLSVLRMIERSKMEIWVTNKVVDTEAVLKWSKSFTVDLPIGHNCKYGFASILINEEKKVVLCCNLAYNIGMHLVYTIGEDNEYYYSEIPFVESTNKTWWVHKRLPHDGSQNKLWWYPFVFNYVPSLVQIL